MRVAVVDRSAIDRRITERLVEREAEFDLVWSGSALPPADIAAALDAVVLDPATPAGADEDLLQWASELPASVAVALFTRVVAAGESWARSQEGGRPTLVVDKDARGYSQVTAFGRLVRPWLATAEPMAHAAAPDAAQDPAGVAPGSEAVETLLLIGASTGGPAAIGDLLRALPKDLDAAICITQHMPDGFTRRFAERLATTTPFHVAEAADGVPLSRGDVVIAPSGRHLELAHDGARVVTRLTDAPPENWCRPAVDRLFRSASLLRGPRVVALVLTGMGRDGESGAAALKDSGARVYVQDEESSVVWGMPGAVANAGFADAVEGLQELASRIRDTVGTPSRKSWRKSS